MDDTSMRLSTGQSRHDRKSTWKAQKKANRQKSRDELKQKQLEAETIAAQVAAIAEREKQDYINARREALDLQNTWKAQHALRSERPEWDLNNPKQARLPARQGDNDPNCGPSSAQKFKGEDLNHVNRKAKLESDRKAYNQRQIEQKAEMQRRAAQKQQDEATQLQKAIEYASNAATQEHFERRYNAYKLQQENKNLARMKKDELRRAKAVDDELSKLEIEVTRSHLNEEQHSGIDTSGRARKDSFKGYGEAELAATLAENDRMVAAHIARTSQERKAAQEEAQHLQTIAAQSQALVGESYLEAKRAEFRLGQELRMQRKDAKQAEQDRNYAAKNNVVGNSFFERFER